MMKTVCVDLDGVLADYSQGFQGIDNIGDPIPGAAYFTRQLRKFAYVVIFTTRCKEYPPGTMERDGRRAPELAAVVEAWLDRHGFAYDEVYTGQGKPMAACYIDDRSVVCRPQSSFATDSVKAGNPDQFTQALWAAQHLCEG